jgi:hypothetical protein
MWVVIFVITAGFALLYWWLMGHWFARTVVFMLFAALGLLMGQTGADQSAPIICAVLGWFISGIPTYVRRRRLRHEY